MRSTALILLVAGLAAAAPHFHLSCLVMIAVPSPTANPVYADLANNASTPQGYYLVFSDLEASTSQSGFSGIKALESYDTFGCQEACDATSGCTAFNMYIERDPSVDPGTNCPNPPSTVNYYCTFWSTAIADTTATNAGQWRGPEDANGQAFHVVITASNGPSSLGGSIQAPLSSTGANTYAGSTSFPGGYDPSQCATACTSQTAYDAATASPDGTYVPCNFFNSYVLSENNVPLGTFCAFYTQAWGEEYATNVGYTDGDGSRYTVSSSYGYTLATQDPGVN
ncbi:hypothetical protein BDV97DRAFT_370006 [Delphinella strobiligena]|nr:hypothetical protein BDV97DRAFT_370006 [Delphinella strobiligena]